MRCLNCMEEFDEIYGVCPHCGFIPGTLPKEAYHLHPGTVLRGRYIVGTTVGFGGFGITYRAWDNVLAKKVAVKEFYPNGIVNRIPGEKSVIIYSGNRANEFENGKRRFLDEARNMARFNTHPNIVNVYEFFEENNTAYIAMEFLEGVSYKEYIAKSGGRVPWEVAVGVVLPVLDALREIHKVKIIHRDISPDNIFMVPTEPDSDRFRVKLIDFGAARFSSGEDEKTLSIILKPGYAPPEQYRSRSRQGPWTDIYAVGAVLYRSITGRMPDESVNRAVEDNLQQPIELAPEIPQYLNDTIMRAMALNQELRFQNVDQFREALQNKARVRDVSSELKRRKWIRGLSIAGICAVLCGMGAACAILYLHKQNSLYHIAADITVCMPDINGAKLEEIASAVEMGEDTGEEETEKKQLSMEGTDEMLTRMLQEYNSRFTNVSVAGKSEETLEDYLEGLEELAESGSLPSVMETSGISSADEKLWSCLGTLDTTFDTLDPKDYYFMGEDGFKAAFMEEKKQIPTSFCAPVLYVNTHMVTDGELLDGLSALTSVEELKEGGFCVSAADREMYREAFRGNSPVDSMEEFGEPKKDEIGYEPFLDREKAFYLGTTDDYEAIRASLGGIYRMVVMDDLQESGKVKGRFTHLWSIDGSLDGDDKTAADNLVYYFMSETAQDIFNLQDGNGLSLSKNMLETYVKSNDEFRDIVDGLDRLQMEY